MNTGLRSVRVGIWRGWMTFRLMIGSLDGIANTLFWNAIPLGFLILNRNADVEGVPLSFGAIVLPGFLGLSVAAAAFGPAYYIAAEREDGTLLRARAVPHGVIAYVIGVLVMAILETAVSVVVLLVPGFILFEGLRVPDAAGWLLFAVVVLLGLAATLPIGVIIGSVVKSPRLIGGAGLLVIGGMAMTSGIFIPLQAFPEWFQTVAQMLPPYWTGMGMRAVFLPPEAVAWEIGGSWRTLEMLAVLGAWSIAGAVVAPIVLRRMARRATGSSVEESREQALQRA